jgi:hypothetical protein
LMSIAVAVLLAVTAACSPDFGAQTVPAPPAELLRIPRVAHATCSHISDPSGLAIGVFEFPGIGEPRWNEPRIGKRGAELGAVPYCAPVTVIDYKWSKIERRFWVQIASDSSVTGWTPLPLVDLSAPESPALPDFLSGLPREGRIQCPADPDPNIAEVGIWEFPGIAERGSENRVYGYRGKLQGHLPFCTTVTITDHEWSEIDERYWVYVKGPDSVEGWTWLSEIEFK